MALQVSHHYVIFAITEGTGEPVHPHSLRRTVSLIIEYNQPKMTAAESTRL